MKRKMYLTLLGNQHVPEPPGSTSFNTAYQQICTSSSHSTPLIHWNLSQKIPPHITSRPVCTLTPFLLLFKRFFFYLSHDGWLSMTYTHTCSTWRSSLIFFPRFPRWSNSPSLVIYVTSGRAEQVRGKSCLAVTKRTSFPSSLMAEWVWRHLGLSSKVSNCRHHRRHTSLSTTNHEERLRRERWNVQCLKHSSHYTSGERRVCFHIDKPLLFLLVLLFSTPAHLVGSFRLMRETGESYRSGRWEEWFRKCDMMMLPRWLL